MSKVPEFLKDDGAVYFGTVIVFRDTTMPWSEGFGALKWGRDERWYELVAQAKNVAHHPHHIIIDFLEDPSIEIIDIFIPEVAS